MEKIVIDLKKPIGKIKPLNSVNNGPKVPLSPDVGQDTGNMADYRALEIPYARTHDAVFYPEYGGDRIIDITSIFPNFDADETLPESYDFYLTDRYLQTMLEVGTKPFYRLGESIEFRLKKYKIVVPKDFEKWARICEHVIRHYNEGWADGFHMGIEYWEIWMEADGDMFDEGANKRQWGGTPEQFYEMYTITAKHLKKCFPNLKIGGPAVSAAIETSWNHTYEETTKVFIEDFFEYIKKENAPLDFFSWHSYACEPKDITRGALEVDRLLKEYGYSEAENILDEYNYISDFAGEKFKESLRTMQNTKGAVYVAACFACAQNSPLDMLMYFDASPTSIWDGIFTILELEKGRTYYTYEAFTHLARLGMQPETVVDSNDIYVLSAMNENRDNATMVSYFTNDKAAENKVIELELNGGNNKEYDFFLLDEDKDLELVKKEFSNCEKTVLYFDMKPNTMLFVKSKSI